MTKISEVVLMRTGQTIKIEGEKGEKGTTFTPSVSEDGTLSWTNDGGKPNPDPVVIKGDKGDTVIIGDEQNYTLYNSEGDNTDGAMTQAAVTRKFKALDETYARLDGYYESMGVGMATNLKGQNTVDAEFTYRKSGGNVEVQDGNAMIEAIKGNTIAWNQLIQNGNFNNTDNWTVVKANFSVANNIGSVELTENPELNYSSYIATQGTFDIDANHKYYVSVEVLCPKTSVFKIDSNAGAIVVLQNVAANTWSKVSSIVKSTSSINTRLLLYPQLVTYGYVAGDIFKVKNIILFDLTLIYGSGKEPATVEQFEQDYFNWFGKPLTYEPYDAGSLRNTKVSALKTTGFNLWDEEWEQGYIRRTDGLKINNSNSIRSKNYCKCKPNTTYRLTCTKSGLTVAAVGVIFYNSEQQYIGGYWASNTTIQTPANAVYFKITTQDSGSSDSTYGGTYNHDICLNISDPNRNGEYEPYKESTLPLDVTTLTGKLNGEGSSVVVFPNGMGENDEIRIEGDVVKAYKRGTIVDMGDLDYSYTGDSSIPFFTTTLPNFYYPQTGIYSKPPIICSIYPTLPQAYRANKSISGNNNDTQKIIISENAYSSSAAFKTAVSGVKLYYALAEHEVYVLDDFSLPKLYPVANGGTEEQLSNSPNSLPATLSIRYGLNAAAFIQNAPKNYISKESMNNFLSNLGSAMGGTWSMTWNSSTNKYDFSFTQNRSAEPITDNDNNDVEPDNNR